MSQFARNSARQRAQHGAPPPEANQPRSIVVPLDGSTHALVALPVAKTLAKIEDATLHFVHVGAPVVPPTELLEKVGLTPDQLRGSIIDQETGSPAATIVAVARKLHSLFIVMCTHTGQTPVQGELGPVATDVLQQAPCPVVLVRPDRGLVPWEFRRVLVPHDGTPTSAAAIIPAADLACCAEAELDVLHVGEPGGPQSHEPGTLLGPHYLDQPQHEWSAWAHEFLERLAELGHIPPAPQSRLFLVGGEPGLEVAQFARDHRSDLIVLAWRGHLEAERATTLKAVLHEEPCPPLIVRAPANRHSGRRRAPKG